MIGRRPHDEKYRKKTFYLPESLITRIDLRLGWDLARATPKQGEWSALVIRLLRNWLEQEELDAQAAQKKAAEQPVGPCPTTTTEGVIT